MYSITSYSELEKNAKSVLRQNTLSPANKKQNYLQQLISNDDPIIATSDYVRAYSQLISSHINNKFLAISRINEDNKYEKYYQGDSQDTWVFKTPINVNYNEDYAKDGIMLGVGGCDNKIAYVMKQSDYEVLNPCREIKTYHKHIKTYKNIF